MSRSNPSAGNTPNPASRFHEWHGSEGCIKYYDRNEKKNVMLKLPFTFVVLDQTSTVKGWNEDTESGIYSNEVRDTRTEPMRVRAFKGRGNIAEGIYANIRDTVAVAGGHFVANLYIAYKGGDGLEIGAIQFKGGALSAWFEFVKEAGSCENADGKRVSAVYAKGVRIKGSKSGKKGKVEFEMPVFELVEISAQTDLAAKVLDETLQDYLKAYFERTRMANVERDVVGERPQADAPFDNESVPEEEPDEIPMGDQPEPEQPRAKATSGKAAKKPVENEDEPF